MECLKVLSGVLYGRLSSVCRGAEFLLTGCGSGSRIAGTSSTVSFSVCEHENPWW